MQNRWKRIFAYYLFVLTALVVVLTLITKFLYEIYEGGSITWQLALMFVLETMTTTGYGELLPFASWPMTVWAIVVMLIGLGGIFFFLATLAAEGLKQRFQELPPVSAPTGIRNHILICGYNPLVESLIQELLRRHLRVLIIESDRESAQELSRTGVAVVWGDPSEADVLKRAGIHAAQSIIAAGTDEGNANVVLQARVLTHTTIVATVARESHRDNLLYAGATDVLNPKVVLAEELSRWALSSLPRTLIAATASVSGLQLIEVPVYPHSEFAGKKLHEVQLRQRTGASILGLWHNGVFEMIEGPNTVLKENSVMTVVGTPEQIAFFRKHSSTRGVRRLSRHDGKDVEETQEIPTEGKYLVAGNDEVGQRVAEILKSRGIEYTLINEDLVCGENCEVGDSTIEEVLLQAGIKEASTYIVTLEADSQAVFTTLLARRLNPKVRILVRVNAVRAVEKLYRAGADTVLSLSEFGARMLARAILSEDWRQVPDQEIEFMEYEVGQHLGGKTIAEANIFRYTNCLVIGFNQDGQFQANPPASTVMEHGSTIMLLGSKPNLKSFLERYGARAVATSE